MTRSSQPTLSMSICLPVYKGSHILANALKSILSQKFTDYEILIGDDNPPEAVTEIRKTRNILESLHDKRIRYFKNKKNLGYPKNVQKIIERAKNDIIFLLGQDDILADDALQITHDAFLLSPQIGAVTRPYFWFEKDITKPIRVCRPPSTHQHTILSIEDEEKMVRWVFSSISQVSGLAMMRRYIDIPCGEHIFTTHMYPFASILKKYSCVFLKDYTVAVGILDSQSRTMSSVYDTSPLETWVEMFHRVYGGEKYRHLRSICIKHIATHYTGLVQLKNFAKPGVLEREIIIMLKYYRPSIFHLKFWAYALLTLFLPRRLLLFMTDNYKRHIGARRVGEIPFTYTHV